MTDRTSPLLKVRNLTVEFLLEDLWHPAIRDVSFDLFPGETFGLAGESGCGKSTAATAIMGMLPDNGRVHQGQVLFRDADLLDLNSDERRKIWWRDIAMIFQGSLNSLNPVRRVGSQITEILRVRKGLSSQKAREKAQDLFRLIGIQPDRIDDYPHEFSGGMRQRVMIAMAVCLDPPLIIADECTTALDVMIQAQIVNLLKELNSRLGLSMVFINHDLGLVAEICDRVGVMYAGRIVETGPVREIFQRPAHPYVRQLIAALPLMHGDHTQLRSIPGTPPRLKQGIPGCAFLPRCERGDSSCSTDLPGEIEISKGHRVACLKLS